jgi:hypothetical protein
VIRAATIRRARKHVRVVAAATGRANMAWRRTNVATPALATGRK